ncbi:MAG: KH domain-containing protein [Mycoplasmoidaceae bacterium]|nr:KH domain-containing protein [Mycoplasmoidaceae bacterium]
MTNNLSSSDLTLLIVTIVLCVIIVACAGIIIYLRIGRKNKKQSQYEIDDYRLEPLNKEIRRYKKLQEQYKNKLIDQDYLDHDKSLHDMQVILDDELEQYKKEQLMKIDQEINQHKNDLLKQMLLNTMQPLHLKVINEASVHYLPIADKYKPLIIGKKGRSIKKLNEITNCNINVDKDSPYVEISCPNPLEKQIAINTINHLIKSEAFDVYAIDNIYKKECRLMEKECYETGKSYLGILNIPVSNNEIYGYIGRLKYR